MLRPPPRTDSLGYRKNRYRVKGRRYGHFGAFRGANSTWREAPATCALLVFGHETFGRVRQRQAHAKHDLSLPRVRNSYLDRVRAKEFDAVLLSPPCSSFSRATWPTFADRGRFAATSTPEDWKR